MTVIDLILSFGSIVRCFYLELGGALAPVGGRRVRFVHDGQSLQPSRDPVRDCNSPAHPAAHKALVTIQKRSEPPTAPIEQPENVAEAVR